MSDPGTRTPGRGLTVGAGGGLRGKGQRGKNWENCNRIAIKYFLNKNKSVPLVSEAAAHVDIC